MRTRRLSVLWLGAALVLAWASLGPPPAPAVAAPAADEPDPGAPPAGYELAKNWDFGQAPGNSIRSIAELSAEFQYHDQFGTIGNGANYGALMVAPDAASALKKQPVEMRDTRAPVREMQDGWLRTRLVPLDDSGTVHPEQRNVGAGSFQARWTLPAGGSRLGCDLRWQTRVRFRAVPYYWFAIWAAGDRWQKGAEIDVVESFGWDNGGGRTNFDGALWHSASVGGDDTVRYKDWRKGMASQGITDFDPEDWHIWTLDYRSDDRYTVLLDGHPVQSGHIHWTLGGKADGAPLNMSFLFDAAWGHTKVASVRRPLPAERLADAYYDWDYSRVYLRCPSEPASTPQAEGTRSP